MRVLVRIVWWKLFRCRDLLMLCICDFGLVIVVIRMVVFGKVCCKLVISGIVLLVFILIGFCFYVSLKVFLVILVLLLVKGMMFGCFNWLWVILIWVLNLMWDFRCLMRVFIVLLVFWLGVICRLILVWVLVGRILMVFLIGVVLIVMMVIDGLVYIFLIVCLCLIYWILLRMLVFVCKWFFG